MWGPSADAGAGTAISASIGGPFLFGERGMADAMFAPLVRRLTIYDLAMPDGATQAWGAPPWRPGSDGVEKSLLVLHQCLVGIAGT